MKRLDYASLILVACATVLLVSLGLSSSVASPPGLSVYTEPPLDQVTPFAEAVEFEIVPQGQDGQALANAQVHLQLHTPAKTPWFSTDFPWVEGTTLLDLETTAVQGKVVFDQVMPLRGTYQLEVDVTPTTLGLFEPFQQTLPLRIHENSIKYRNGVVLLLVLLGVGALGGWVIAGGRREVDAPDSVRLLLSGGCGVAIAALLTVNLTAENAPAHQHDHPAHSHVAATTEALKGSQAGLTLSGDTYAFVGQLATQTVTATNPQTGQPLVNAPLTIRTVSLEDDELIFQHRAKTDAQGQFTWREQFFDATTHQVMVEVQPPSATMAQPLTVSQRVEVEGKQPPLLVRFITLSYMLIVVGLGVAVGFQTRRFVSPDPTA